MKLSKDLNFKISLVLLVIIVAAAIIYECYNGNIYATDKPTCVTITVFVAEYGIIYSDGRTKYFHYDVSIDIPKFPITALLDLFACTRWQDKYF